MDIQLRIASHDDLAFLVALEKECFPAERRTSRRSLRLSIISDFQHVMIAEVDKEGIYEPVAAAILYTHKTTFRVFSIAVLPAYQSAGIGIKLMSKIEEMAHHQKCNKISLEVDAQNTPLVDWYKKQGFKPMAFLDNYYGVNQHAHRMFKTLSASISESDTNGKHPRIQNLVVVSKPIKWMEFVDNTTMVLAQDYLMSPIYQKSAHYRVFNLCDSYKYQSLGYYVSLLASARDHRCIPNVVTIRDFTSSPILKSISEDVDEIIQKSLRDIPESQFTLNIYFGHASDRRFTKLAKEMYSLFESPFLKVVFMKSDVWYVKKMTPLSIHSIPQEDRKHLSIFAGQYFSQKRFHRSKFKPYKYDLAILVNPDEKLPPSCPKALEKFKKAAQKVGFYAEFITQKDYHRICEYDALFIRETTDVNNYTYNFSRYAYAEGLVVIDDPWSILRCSNKMYLDERMRKGNIKTPHSWTFIKHSFNPEILHQLHYPVVLKAPDSCFSLGVFKATDYESCLSQLTAMFHSSELIIAQEFIESEYDWRIGVLDNKPLFACRYYMAKNHWQIYNWGSVEEQEGQTETFPLDQVPENVIATAVKAASLIGDGLYGIDLKELHGKVYLIEINDNPNIDDGIEDAVLGDELYTAIMKSLYNRIEFHRDTPRFISF